MKFVCDNCKAKYQIADEKVAGKTVRMKCRRCEHVITVSATVTESSVSRRPPTSPALAAEQERSDAIPPGDEEPDEATMVMRAPPNIAAARRVPPPPRPAAGRASVPGPPPRISSPGAAPPPRPSPGGASAHRPAAPPPRPPASSGASLTALAERARAQSNPGFSGASPAPPGQPHLGSAQAPSGSGQAPTGGLAGAFSRAIAEPAKQAVAVAPSDDWYVGVGGVPLGPIRLSDIREKAAAGAVSGDSLVWREGFDEWQPLQNFPTLLEIVEEARNRRSLVTPTPAPVRRAAPPPVASAPFNLVKPSPPSPAPQPGPSPQPAPAPLAAAPERLPIPAAPSSEEGHAVVPIIAPPPNAASSAPPGGSLDILSDPFARPEPPKKTNGASHAPGAPVAMPGASIGVGQSSPGDAPASAAYPQSGGRSPFADANLGAPPPPSLSADLSVASRLPGRRRGLHPMAYAFIAMAAVFGGVAAWVLFARPPQVVFIEKQMEAAGFPVGAPAPPPPPTGDEASGEVPPQGQTAEVATGPAPVGGGPAPAPKGGSEPSTPGGANIDTSGFDVGVGGPSVKSGGGSEDQGSGAKLSQGQIEGVVSRNQSLVRRRCWDPALASAPSSAPKSAKVNASITIGASGGVQSASASGAGNHYPSLAPCIASQIQGWKFPSSGGTTKVNVPFSFLGH